MQKVSPFRDIAIFPSYNKGVAVVSWVVSPELKDAEFYVYRKLDGGAEWKLLSEEPTFGTIFADTDFSIPNKINVPHYKILALLGDDEYESPDVALFSHTDRRAFGIAQNIIRANYLQFRQDGIPVLYYPAIKNGDISTSIDSLTGQRNKTTCAKGSIGEDGDEEDDNDYGTYYKGGYYRPFMTFVRFMGPKNQRTNILDEGTFDESVQQAKFLAFPPVRTGDMVVDVTTDRRWLVGTSIQSSMVKSVIPVGYSASLTLQSHNHPCYSVPIPRNYSVLHKRLLWPEMNNR